MKIGILTSSRADFGIYLPLLSKLKKDSFFNLEIIAFGTHLSKVHGFTVSEIENEGFNKIHKISSLLTNDDKQSISTSFGITALKFADFWATNQYDLVFCLGDRFEMCAAVVSAIPFGVKFAHLHGGETTLGAIDNIYRHQITHASTLHFTSTELYSTRVAELIAETTNIFTVGSLSLDSIEDFSPIIKSVFYDKFKILYDDFALVTFHPETVEIDKNMEFVRVMRNALRKISDELYLVISMPNADTLGSLFREELIQLSSEFPNRIVCVETFGKENYFTAMYYSKLLIGNTSSGIIEAASFGKYVVNVGNRQKGRIASNNVINVGFNELEIVSATKKALKSGNYTGGNIYKRKNTSDLILNKIKFFYETL
jgi:GDP/UDP-N,N'-diacetylbacillosamine 2-epimerase (hydrolysing)